MMNIFTAKKKKIKLTASEKIFNVINYMVFGIITVICILPFYYIFINTISSNDAVSKGQVLLLPIAPHISNYLSVITIPGLSQAAIISVLRTVIGTSLTVLASAFLGYVFTKNEMWGRKVWYRFVVITMYFNAGLIPWFIVMYKLGLTNNFLAYIIPAIVQPFNVILVKTYIESTPIALQEAAEIDGAGNFTIFTKIILPIITPILATIAIFAAVGQWNSYTDTVILMTDQRLYSLQYRLYLYITQSAALASQLQQVADPNVLKDAAKMQTPLSVQMTVSVVVLLPILCVYPFFQRFFVKGIMIGSIKG